MSELRIAVVQAQLQWHKVDANLEHISELIKGIKDVDLIVLPEMWSTGFTMMAHRYHPYTPTALGLMQEWAAQQDAVIIGSLITQQEDKCYNRLYCVGPAGLIETYDKRHLFAFAGEDRSFNGGTERKEIIIKGFTLRLQVCYDLRFPVWSRNDTDYDMLVYVANWPDKRIDAWQTLLRARAIENQAFVIGCNCVGQDLWSNTYTGYSALLAPDGHYLATAEGESILYGTISIADIQAFRTKFPFLRDRDAFSLEP